MKLRELIESKKVYTQKEMKDVYKNIQSEEIEYRKKVLSLKFRIATKPEHIKTVIKGKVETENDAKEGDYIVQGAQGEDYVLTPKKFNDRYVIKGKRAETKPVKTKAKIATNPLTFMASWGEKMICDVGDAVINNKGEYYRIEKDSFSKTYEKT